MRSTIAAVFAVFGVGAATAQPAELPDRGEALVASSRAFVFYSDRVTNLHDFLIWNTFSRDPIEPAPECLAGLPTDQRTAFEAARAHYAVFRTPAGNRLLLALRFRLAGFGDGGLADAAAIEAALAVLPPATPAYEKCWWPAHDARNRRWIAALEPLLAAHEEAVSTRLAELYGEAPRRRTRATQGSSCCFTRRRTPCSVREPAARFGPSSRRRRGPTVRRFRRSSITL